MIDVRAELDEKSVNKVMTKEIINPVYVPVEVLIHKVIALMYVSVVSILWKNKHVQSRSRKKLQLFLNVLVLSKDRGMKSKPCS